MWENTARRFSLAPQALAGAGEKPRNRVDPLFVSCPRHPFRGRSGDRTERRLADAEVVALHATRRDSGNAVRAVPDDWGS